jgi:GNAT superfamily N-acetyltransferase
MGDLVTRERQRFWKMSWLEYDQRKNDVPTVDEAKRRLDFIWTHRDQRRHGIATALIRAAVRHHRVALVDLAWGAPFEPDGEALARRLSRGSLRFAAD